jgi:hypothetical protein
LMTAIISERYFIPKGTTTNTTTTEATYLNRNVTGCFVFPGCQNHPQSKFFLHQANICKALLNSLYTCKISITSKDGTFFGHQSVRVVFPDPAHSHFVDGALQMRGALVLLQCDRLGFHGL